MRTNRWFRGGFAVLALFVFVGLVFIACHKKEGAEQSRVAPRAPAAAPAPVEQVQVALPPVITAAPGIPAPAVVPPAPKAPATVALKAPAVQFVSPKELEGLRAPARPEPAPQMSAPIRPDGGSMRGGYRVDPATGELIPLPPPDFGRDARDENRVSFPPIQGDTVTVSELPPGEEPSFEVIHRVRAHKEPVTEPTVPSAGGNANYQDASAPETPPSSLISDEGVSTTDLRPDALSKGTDPLAPIAPGTPSISFKDWSGPSTDGVPFDADMAVGQTYIMTDVNSRFHIYDKSGVVQNGAAGTTMRTFFNTAGTPNCGAAETATNFMADPQISYDDQNDRWVLLMLRATVTSGGIPIQSWLCVACSQTSDPRGTWNKYEVSDGVGLADYPHLGIGEDAVFVGTNHFNNTTGAFDNANFLAINKNDMYTGVPAPATRKYSAGTGIFTPQPAERRGYLQGQYPPAGTAHMFVVRGGGVAQIWRWPQPTFSSNPANWWSFSIASTTPPAISGTNITTYNIDGGDSRPLDAELRWPYLWYTRGAVASTRGAVEWGGADVSGGTPTLYQSGTYGDAALGFFWPDCTVDKNHNFAVGFTGAANTGSVFPGAYVTGRENTITPNNTLEALQTSKLGEVKYNSWEATTSNWRWGDYAGVSVDPNGCDIWTMLPYTTGATTPTNATWVRKYKFPSCSETNNLTIDNARYGCTDIMYLTVEDSTAITAAALATAVVITSPTDTEHIAAGGWTDVLGTGKKWTATLAISSTSGTGNDNGTLKVTDGAALSAVYTDPHPTHPVQTRNAAVDCSADLQDGGYIVEGGCDATSVGETYNIYMDRNEVVAYTFGIYNNEFFDLTDARVTLSASGAGASAITIYNPTVNIGRITTQSVSGAVFNIAVNGSVAGLTPVTLTASVTSPADGLTTPTLIAQTRLLQADDTILTLQDCSTHQTGETTWGESALTGYVNNAWTIQTTAGETGFAAPAVDYFGLSCGNSTGNSYATGNMTNTAKAWATNCYSALRHTFQPANRGIDAGSGQPWQVYYVLHSFYSANETNGNTSGVWGSFFSPEWNSATQPTGDQVDAFPYSYAYYYHSVFDWGTDGNDWDATNAGTPNHPVGASQPLNQLVWGLGLGPYDSTASSYFALGHEHIDGTIFGITYTAKGDVAMDNNNIIYDNFHAIAQVATCTAGSVPGQISWDKYTYSDCPTTIATLSVLDQNAVSGFTATVSAGGTGDTETVTFTGTAPYFTGTITLATNAGGLAADGTLFVLPTDTLTASYTDTNPAGTVTQTASYACTSGGDVVYVSYAQPTSPVSDNGDNDGYADNKETVTIDITIQNNMGNALNNTQVKLVPTSANIDCITDDTALYGTVGAGATATNPGSDRFTFHVKDTVQCTAWQTPPTATFLVLITGTGFSGSSTMQTFPMNLDLDATTGSYNYTWNFSTDPGWTTSATGDDDGSCPTTPYVNNFRYRPDGRAAGNGAYGAWKGTGGTFTNASPTGYPVYDSSTLYSPILTANGNVTLQFQTGYKINATYHGAKVQAKVGAGAWTNVPFTLPTAQTATTTNATYCSSMDSSPADNVWTSAAGQTWAATNIATVTATAGQTIQFRWRMASDSTAGGAALTGGFAVDDVALTGLQQTYGCETTRNTGLPACAGGCTLVVDVTPNGTTTVCGGTGILYTVGYTGGTAPYTYQWTEDGVNIGGATSSTYTATYATAQSHTYNCKVSCTGCTNIVDATNSTGTWTTKPGAPVVTGITDVSACAATGIQVAYTAGSGATSHDLYKDGVSAVTGYVSGATYTPGDTASHNYMVRAITGSCTTDSNTMAGTDADGTPGAPVITGITDVSACAATGIQVAYTAGSGAVSHDLYKDGVSAVTGYVSGATYTPGDTASHNYTVRAINGTCTTDSNTMADTDANNTPGAPVITGITDVDAYALSGIQVSYTAGSGAVSHDLYKDGVSAVTGYVSGATYTPGDAVSHNYTVRAINGTCTTDSNTMAGTDVFSAPPEAAPGTGGSGTAQTWSDKNTQNWPAGTGATSYNMYRGVLADLTNGNILNGNNDSCTRYQGGATSIATLTEDPGLVAGRFYWYIVTGQNGAGEGSAGNASSGARVVNSTGVCP